MRLDAIKCKICFLFLPPLHSEKNVNKIILQFGII